MYRSERPIGNRVWLVMGVLCLALFGIASCSRVNKAEIPVKLAEADSGIPPTVEMVPVPAWMVGLYRPQAVRPGDGSLTIWVGRDGYILAEATAAEVRVQGDGGRRERVYVTVKYRGSVSPQGEIALNPSSKTQRSVASGKDTIKELDLEGMPTITGKVTKSNGKPSITLTRSDGTTSAYIRER